MTVTDLAIGRVSPFGHPGITARLQLPQAYRSLPRPSSPLDAKASTVCLIAFDLKRRSTGALACLRSRARHSWRKTVAGPPHGVDSSHPVCRCRQTNHPSIDCQRARPIPSRCAQRSAPGPAKKSECELDMRECGRLPRLFRRRHPGRRLLEISRKEVIQPQVPLRLPCYDFAPVTELTFDGCLLAVSAPSSGRTNSHGVTGGVYKARERIHRGMLILDY